MIFKFYCYDIINLIQLNYYLWNKYFLKIFYRISYRFYEKIFSGVLGEDAYKTLDNILSVLSYLFKVTTIQEEEIIDRTCEEMAIKKVSARRNNRLYF